MNQATLIFGASNNPSRYSFKATTLLVSKGHDVYPVGVKKGTIGDTDIINEHVTPDDIDTLTLYVNADIQDKNQDYLLSIKPKRVIFNPGTENPALARKFREQGTEVQFACTLVMLNTGQY